MVLFLNLLFPSIHFDDGSYDGVGGLHAGSCDGVGDSMMDLVTGDGDSMLCVMVCNVGIESVCVHGTST